MYEKSYSPPACPEDILQRISETHEITGHFDDKPIMREQLLEAVSDRDAILCSINDVIDKSLFDTAPALKIVANIGVGYNNIDIEEASKRGVLVTNTPGVLTDATADLTMALILSVSRRVVEGDRMVREGGFRFWGLFHFLGRELSGKTLGIIGLGRIGQAVAARATAFGMKILYHNRHRLSSETEQALKASFTDFDTLLSNSDLVSLHTPLTDETRHLITGKELSLMKNSAFLINTSRGPVVDEKAVKAVCKLPKKKQPPFRNRLKNIMESANGIGWGYYDDLCHFYHKAFE